MQKEKVPNIFTIVQNKKSREKQIQENRGIRGDS